MADLLPPSYAPFLAALKERVSKAQVKAAISVNRELVQLYWEIGRAILEQQERYGWGAKVIDQLSADLKRAFPQMEGFSPRNLKYGRWPRRGPMKQLCNSLLHKFLGDTTCEFWTK